MRLRINAIVKSACPAKRGGREREGDGEEEKKREERRSRLLPHSKNHYTYR